MGQAPAIAITVGAVTLANEALFAPLAQHPGRAVQPGQVNVNWRIIPATALFALGLGALERLSEPFAAGLGYIALFTVLFTRTGNALSPVENLSKVLGYGGKA